MLNISGCLVHLFLSVPMNLGIPMEFGEVSVAGFDDFPPVLQKHWNAEDENGRW